MNIPEVSIDVDVTNVAGVRLDIKGSTGAISFDMKVKLEEKERRSQQVIVNFNLLLTTKPAVVKFRIEGFATLNTIDLIDGTFTIKGMELDVISIKYLIAMNIHTDEYEYVEVD